MKYFGQLVVLFLCCAEGSLAAEKIVREDAASDRCLPIYNRSLMLRRFDPIYAWSRDDQGFSFRAVRPFFSTYHDSFRERRLSEYLWPVATRTRFENGVYWRFLIAFGYNYDMDDPQSQYRMWILPFYFQGRGRNGKLFRAFFPFGGVIRDFFGWDETHFVLWPCWIRTLSGQKETRTVLWPLISWSKGPRNSSFRVAPFYGQTHVEGSFKKRFVLWPFYTSARYLDPRDPGYAYMVWPLWSRTSVKSHSTLLLLPPFIRFTRGPEVSVTYLPWPFIQRYKTVDLDKTYIWPLWGRRRIGPEVSDFLIWPLGRFTRSDRAVSVLRRNSLFPFYYATTETIKAEGVYEEHDGVARRILKIWPLFSYQRDGDCSRFRIFEFWPGKQMEQWERNWAPLFSVFSRNKTKDSVETNLLWGLYRNTQAGERRQVRVLYFLKFGDKELRPL